jgi:hypothetical protein
MPYLRGSRLGNLPTKTWYPTFWLKHDFNVDTAAPIASYIGDGLGTLTISDTNSKFSVLGGKALFATGGASASGNPGAWAAQQTRLAGRAVLGIITSSASNFEIGWDSDQSGTLWDAIRIQGSGTAIRDGGTAVDIGLSLTGGPFLVAVVQRAAGFWAFLRGAGFPNWVLEWVGVTTTGNLYPSMAVNSTTFVGNVDTLRGVDLPAPLDSDYGFATQRLSGARAANDVFIHEPNIFLEWKQTTLPASGNTDIRFRVVDANNYLQATVSSTGALTINEVLAGTPTQLFTSAAAVAANNRVSITADGSAIRAYVGVVTKGSGTSTNFLDASSGLISALGTSGAVSDLISWPRYAPQQVATLLNMAFT